MRTETPHFFANAETDQLACEASSGQFSMWFGLEFMLVASGWRSCCSAGRGLYDSLFRILFSQGVIIEIVWPGGVGGARIQLAPSNELGVKVHEKQVESRPVCAVHWRVQVGVEKSIVGAGETRLKGLPGWIPHLADFIGRRRVGYAYVILVERSKIVIGTGKRQNVRVKSPFSVQLVIEANSLLRGAAEKSPVVGADVRMLQSEKINARHRRPTRRRAGEGIVIIAGVHLKEQPHLLQVGSAFCPLRLFFRRGQGRKEQRRQNADDRDDHQQFNQSKASGFFRRQTFATPHHNALHMLPPHYITLRRSETRVEPGKFPPRDTLM